MTKIAFFLYRKRIQFVAVKVECFCKRFRHESSQQKVKFYENNTTLLLSQELILDAKKGLFKRNY